MPSISAFTPDEELVFDVYLDLCEGINTPRALTGYLLAKNKEFKQLVTLDFDPEVYEPLYHPRDFQGDYAVSKYFSKYKGLDIGIDKMAVAKEKWLSCEETCKQINHIFRQRWDGRVVFEHDVEEVIHLARQKIHLALSDYTVDELYDNLEHGPGQDLDTGGMDTHPYFKFLNKSSVTPACLGFLKQLLSEDARLELVERARLVSHSKIAFVPKSAKTHRSIEVNPRWNMYLQKAIGVAMERRLKSRCGIDIHSQEWNQYLASIAHKRDLATVDLSSASDSISANVVVDLFPEDWVELMCVARTSYVSYEGSLRRLEKFSAMGNGFTFPMQTLLFYALTSAVEEVSLGDLSPFCTAYGDDIICRRQAFPLLQKVFTRLGFSINVEKSFTDGYFFESCGKDYYQGKNVRPFFQKERVVTISEVFKISNGLTAFGLRRTRNNILPRWVWRINRRLHRSVPPALRVFGPICAAPDACFWAPFDMGKPSRYGGDSQLEGWAYQVILPTSSRKTVGSYQGLLFSKLAGVTQSGNFVPDRGAKSGWRRATALCHTYQDFVIADLF